MDGAESAPQTAEVPTLRQQWIMVAGFAGMVMLCMGLEAWDYAVEVDQGKKTPYEVIAAILSSIGCALWLTMDRKRLGLDVGAWRFWGLFLGPATVCLHIVLRYKGRALFLLPIVVAIYLAVTVLPYLVVLGIRQF